MGIRDIENGNYTILEQNNQLELRISCISGYKLLGDSKIICSDGELPSRLKPQCVRGKLNEDLFKIYLDYCTAFIM